jgi:hypothetical protein
MESALTLPLIGGRHHGGAGMPDLPLRSLT